MKTIKKMELKWKKVTLKNRSFVPFARSLLEDEVNEVFLTFYLNTDLEIIGYQETGRGGNTQVNADVSDIIRGALIAGAIGIAVAHNHSSSINSGRKPTPSPNDIGMTKKLKGGTDFFDLLFLDHVIIGDRRHFSFVKETYLLDCSCEKCEERRGDKVFKPKKTEGKKGQASVSLDYDPIIAPPEGLDLSGPLYSTKLIDIQSGPPLTPEEAKAFEVIFGRFPNRFNRKGKK
jgi:hypothetical protein